MGDISVNTGSVGTLMKPALSLPRDMLSATQELNVTVSDGNEEYQVSAEAQYLFEIQIYFNKIDDTERQKTIEYFAQSKDPLDNKVADTLRETDKFIKGLRDGTITIEKDEAALLKAKNLIDPNGVIDGTTEVGVRPNGSEVFRMDGKKDYNPFLASADIAPLTKQLDALEKASSGLFRNRDSANLFGYVGNLLGYSQTIFLSADDVLHYNYTIAEAKKTIDFVNPPADLKSALTDLIAKGIAWQNEQQSKFISDNRKFIGNARVGNLAAEAVRMGTAAQAFNQQLSNTLASSTIPFLNSGSLIKRMIISQPDLIRFSPDKIDDAMNYYRANDAEYDKALNRGFFVTVPEQKDPFVDIYKKISDAGQKYALKVIGEIQRYVLNK